MDTPIVALAIEDDSEDFFILNRLFQENKNNQLVWAKSLEAGLESIERHDFDVILLDLSLPDSRGIATVKEFMELDTAPIVVLSGLDDEQTALESVQSGAQDYLVKGSFSADLLFRTMRHAVERNRLQRQLNASQQEVQRQRELRRLQSDASLAPVSADTAVNEGKPLKSAHLIIFQQSIRQYSSILDNALEQRAFKIEHKVSDALRKLANELGDYKATPRDVVEIHTAVITEKISDTLPQKNRVINEEARYLLAGVLGHLCSFYRSDSLRFRASPDYLTSCLESDAKH